MIAALVAIAAQAATPTQQCGMIAVSGDPIAFGIVATPGGVTLVPTSGSAWPSASLTASWSIEGTGERIGVGPDGGQLALKLGAMNDGFREATLFGMVDGTPGIPLAVGYCDEDGAKDVSGARAATVADVEAQAFDRSRWPDTCVAITSEGKRVQVEISFPRVRDAVNFDSSLWTQGVVSVFTKDKAPQRLTKGVRLTPRPFAPKPGVAGPSGDMMDYLLDGLKPPAFVRLLELRNLASDAAPSARAICGTRSIIRTVITSESL